MGQVAGWLGLEQMMGYILCERDSQIEPENAPVRHWRATGWILEGPLNSMGGDDNKFLSHRYLVSVLDQQGSYNPETGWLSMSHQV